MLTRSLLFCTGRNPTTRNVASGIDFFLNFTPEHDFKQCLETGHLHYVVQLVIVKMYLYNGKESTDVE